MGEGCVRLVTLAPYAPPQPAASVAGSECHFRLLPAHCHNFFHILSVNVERNMSNGHNLWSVTDPLEYNGCRVTFYISHLVIIGHAHLPKPKEEFH